MKNWFRDEFGRDCTQEELYAQLIRRTYDVGIDRRIVGNGALYLPLTTDFNYIELIDNVLKG